MIYFFSCLYKHRTLFFFPSNDILTFTKQNKTEQKRTKIKLNYGDCEYSK